MTDLAEYQQLMIDSAVPLETTAEDGAPFLGSIDACAVDGITIMRVDSVAQRVRRTGSGCRRTPSDLVKVLVQRTGEARAEQQGRRTTVGPRSLVVYDTAAPYEVVQRVPFTADALLVPRDRLPGGSALLELLEGRALGTDRGPGALFVSFLGELRTRVRECSPEAASRCTSILLELLRAAVVEEAVTSLSGPALRVLVMDWIDRHLADEDLAPAGIAAAHGISVRYLHRLIADSGVGVSGHIRSERMRRIRADLVDPAFRHRTIAAVGARWGIADPAHLSRLFRAEFAQTPGEVRRQGVVGTHEVRSPSVPDPTRGPCREVQDVVHPRPTVT